MVVRSGSSAVTMRASSSASCRVCSCVSCRPVGSSTCSPDDPLVLMKQGRPLSSQTSLSSRAASTTNAKGASLGSRSRMHQSGRSRDPMRLDQMWMGMDAPLATYSSDSMSSHTK